MEITLTATDLKNHGAAGEWLETNGLGGYASSSIDWRHTRKYHGLLVANLKNPPGRQVLLSKFEDSIRVDDSELFLSAHQYPGFSFPPGGVPLTEFRQGLYPSFRYRRDGIEAQKSVLSIYGEDLTLLRYEITTAPGPGILRLRPFLAGRGYHGLAQADTAAPWQTEELENGIYVAPPSALPGVFITMNRPVRFVADPGWYHNFEYLEERDRGYGWREDLYQPGIIEIPIVPGRPVFVSLSLAPPAGEAAELWQEEETRREGEAGRVSALLAGHDQEDRINLGLLNRAARQFVIRTPEGRAAVIAGYHWFTDWGRDTLISLPGLTFCQGHLDEGLAILTHLGRHEKDGLLPNYFSEDSRDNPYNTIDSSLWFFRACQQYLLYGGNRELLQPELWPTMKRIVRAFLAGTSYDIYVNPRGLLHGGDKNTHLTWMDACIAGVPVTPRHGYAVEINALWYNALGFYLELAASFGEDHLHLRGLFAQAREAFNETFWMEERGYLGDVYHEGRLDPALRPNQLLAVSLPYSPVTIEQGRSIVAAVQNKLLTPAGLRTLAPDSPGYQGCYGGDQAARDSAYHQGTVWPWLLGPYGEACLRVSAQREQTRQFLLEFIRDFLRQHFREAGIGTISEVFSGDPPHRPQGCISQAWSIAEIIRLYGLLKPGNGHGFPL